MMIYLGTLFPTLIAGPTWTHKGRSTHQYQLFFFTTNILKSLNTPILMPNLQCSPMMSRKKTLVTDKKITDFFFFSQLLFLDPGDCLSQPSELWVVRTTAQKYAINQAVAKLEVLNGDVTDVLNEQGWVQNTRTDTGSHWPGLGATLLMDRTKSLISQGKKFLT